MGSTKDVVPIPDDGAVLPAEAVAAITNGDAYSETSAYSKHRRLCRFRNLRQTLHAGRHDPPAGNASPARKAGP